MSTQAGGLTGQSHLETRKVKSVESDIELYKKN